MKMLLIFIAGFIFCLSPNSRAENQPYVGINGQLMGSTLKAHNNPPTENKIFVKTVLTKNFYLGHEINDYLSSEVGFHHFEARQTGIKHNARGVHGTMVVRNRLNETGLLHGYAGIGLVHLRHCLMSPKYEANFARAVARAIAGIEMDLNEWSALRTGAVWHNSKKLSRKPEKFNDSYSFSCGVHFYF